MYTKVKSLVLKASAGKWTKWDEFKYALLRRWHRTWLSNFLYWIRCNTINKYHIVNLKDEGEGYGYRSGWLDKDWAMLISCFKILKEYVEKEEPFTIINWNSDVMHKNAAKEIRELYIWWTKGRKKEHDRLHKIDFDVDFEKSGMKVSNKKNFNKYCKLSKELEEKDQVMLNRLIAIRKFLWT